ncbi:MAG: hypothetical protein P1V36_06560 [Planctomycetota bacterium]|nr:hypothetical protein [Planctomycetota bacterium]
MPQRVRVSRGALGTVLEALADHEGARSQHAEAVAELRLERQRDPENARLEWDLRVALTRLAAAEGQNKAWRVARRLLAEARALQRERVLAHPGRAEEIAGAADVEYAEATVFLAEAAVSETLQANIEAYRGAIRHLEAGVSALARIESQGTLRPQFQQNIALWRSMIEQLQEAIRKLEALR